MFFHGALSRIVVWAEMESRIGETMNILQRNTIKFAIIAAVMLLAGVCYRCSREPAVEPRMTEENVLILSSSPEEAAVTGTSDSGKYDLPETLTNEEYGILEETPEQVVLERPSCFVHICGAVKAPGVYELPQGSRIYQAIDTAGGFLPEADQSFLNLAQQVADGMKITVFTSREAETASGDQGIVYSGNGSGNWGDSSPNSGTAEKAKVNINTAGKEELMTLRGIGASRAEDIIAYREKHGSFQKIEDIMKVSGIKDAAFEKIKEDITV